MGADAAIPPNTMNIAGPQMDAPAAVWVRLSVKYDTQKNALPGEDQNEAAERPYQGWDTI
jgi:hypothetical protein